MQWTNSEGVRIRPPESLPSLRNQRSASQSEAFSVLREYVDVGEFGAKELPPQLNELMAAARKRLNQKGSS